MTVSNLSAEPKSLNSLNISEVASWQLAQWWGFMNERVLYLFHHMSKHNQASFLHYSFYNNSCPRKTEWVSYCQFLLYFLLDTLLYICFSGGVENQGCSAMAFGLDLLYNSTRYSQPNTKKLIIYATSGHITDQDVYFGRHVNSWTYAATWFKSHGTLMQLNIC